MSIETVLIQLQSMLIQLDGEMSNAEKVKLIKDCKKFTHICGDEKHTFDNPFPRNITYEEVVQKDKRRRFMKRIPNKFRKRVDKFLGDLKDTKQTEFCSLMSDILQQTSSKKDDDTEEAEDDTITCYHSQNSYQESVL
eukprot:UN23930